MRRDCHIASSVYGYGDIAPLKREMPDRKRATVDLFICCLVQEVSRCIPEIRRRFPGASTDFENMDSWQMAHSVRSDTVADRTVRLDSKL